MPRVFRASGSVILVAALAVACEKPSNIRVEPNQPVLTKRGQTIQMVAHVMDGSVEDAKADVVWSSANPKIVKITPGGVISGVASGIASVKVVSDGVPASVPVEVRFVDKITAVDKVVMNYEDDYFDPKVVVTTYNGIVLNQSPMFASQNDKICRVDSRGYFHPGDAGETVVTASLDGQSISIPCTVNPPKTKRGRRR